MNNGTGRTFEHALLVAEHEHMHAEERMQLTWRHRLDLAVARVRAEGDEKRLAGALEAVIREATEWQAELAGKAAA